MGEKDAIVFHASLPPLQSAITLDGHGDGGRVKLDVPRSDVEALLRLQGWAECVLLVRIELEQDGTKQY